MVDVLTTPPSAYAYKPDHESIDFNLPLWKLKNDYPAEWAEVARTFSRIKLKSAKLFLENEEIKAIIADDDQQVLPDLVTFIDLLAVRTNKTYGWLIEKCVNAFRFNSEIVNILCDFHDTYKPIKLIKDIEIPVIYQELGSSLVISVEAEGIPRPKYHWFYLSSSTSNSINDWKILDILNPLTNRLCIENFNEDDVGFYRCHINHGLPVKIDETHFVQGIYSKYVEVRIAHGSIIITEEPKAENKGYLSGCIEIRCVAKSLEPITYQWYCNDQKLIGEDRGILSIRNLRLEHAGHYHCIVSNEINEIQSRRAALKIGIPNFDEIVSENLNFDNENIQILRQPELELANKRANIGDKISLSCTAVCKYPLKFEWLKRGVSKDLINNHETQLTKVLHVARGPQLTDEIIETPKISVGIWIYQCVITCPKTGERILSKPIRVPLSTYSSPSKSYPTFKIALIICQEEYISTDYFHELQAPKYDGASLIKSLKELDFEVLSFINLTLEEIRNALELFGAFVSDTTYALVYYNGHAIGFGTDIYLTGVDSELSATLPLEKQFIWHGEIETKLDQCHPLLCVIIYDSCRDNPPKIVEDVIRSTKHDTISCSSSFCISYGTRPQMKSFEYYDKNAGACQGLYMKYLLRHITSNIRVEQVFLRLSDSFTKEEDQSVAHKMRPESKNSTKQSFSLTAPLRTNASSSQQKLFFNMCRYESHVPSSMSGDGFEDSFKYVIGLCWRDANFIWVTGAKKNVSACQGLVTITVKPSTFLNEAQLILHFQNLAEEATSSAAASSSSESSTSSIINNYGSSFPDDDCWSIQLVGYNVCIVASEEMIISKDGTTHAVDAVYEPCSKKLSATFAVKDGPKFLPRRSVDNVIGECKLVNLQLLEENVKLRILVIHGSKVIPCKGFMEFPLPIVKNFPRLKINNQSLRFSY